MSLGSHFIDLNMKVFVSAKTNAKIEKIEKVSDVEFKVWVNQVPEGGKANNRIIELLAEHLNIPKSSIELTRGQKSKTKVFEILQ